MSFVSLFTITILLFHDAKGRCTYTSAMRKDNVDERGPFHEGDMIFRSFDDPTTSSTNSLNNLRGLLWPNAQLVYTLDPAFQPHQVEVIKEAFRDISSRTCVTFKERSNINERDYVLIQSGERGSGCWSFVGRVGGEQRINLENPACIQSGTISHEILHSLNRLHEQSRFDRDDYIFINYTNIQPGTEGNFRRYSKEQQQTFNVPYDYNSIMHYSPYAFSRLPQVPTIIPRQRGAQIGQRVALSQRDSEIINLLYGCFSRNKK